MASGTALRKSVFRANNCGEKRFQPRQRRGVRIRRGRRSDELGTADRYGDLYCGRRDRGRLGGNRGRRRNHGDILRGWGSARSVLVEGFGQLAAPVMDLRETSDRGEVLRRGAKHLLQLFLGLFVAADFDERSTESDARGQIGWVALKARFTRRDGLFELPGASVFLGKSGERDRCRVHLDPALQFFDAGTFGHYTDGPSDCGPRRSLSSADDGQLIEIVCETDPVFPTSSVTVSVTVNVNRCV